MCTSLGGGGGSHSSVYTVHRVHFFTIVNISGCLLLHGARAGWCRNLDVMYCVLLQTIVCNALDGVVCCLPLS